MKRASKTRRLTGLLCALALVAVFTRALVPSGYMIAPGANGGLTMTLCTGQGPMRMDMPMDMGSHKAPSDNAGAHEHAPCVFGASAHLAMAPIQPALRLPGIERYSATVRAQTSFVGQGLAAPPPPSHAPPSVV